MEVNSSLNLPANSVRRRRRLLPIVFTWCDVGSVDIVSGISCGNVVLCDKEICSITVADIEFIFIQEIKDIKTPDDFK